ncbi:MAG: NTP transferase domain-containing protein, partial [Alcanivorax sp.]|nr:NTP transferase domain-containing protein [Alcanivorax sp.]
MENYTLIILAGGQGKRVGGADKGLLELDGKPLIAHLLDHLTPSPSRIVISANRNQATYRHWADQVVSDERDGFQGPMAGLEAALDASQGLCLCLPCDLVQPPGPMPGDLLKKA